MTQEQELATAEFRYKWQDDDEKMIAWHGHERYLSRPLYRLGLVNAGNWVLPALFEDVRANGIRDPIEVCKADTGYRVIRGNQRLAIARAMGFKTLRCVVREDKRCKPT